MSNSSSDNASTRDSMVASADMCMPVAIVVQMWQGNSWETSKKRDERMVKVEPSCATSIRFGRGRIRTLSQVQGQPAEANDFSVPALYSRTVSRLHATLVIAATNNPHSICEKDWRVQLMDLSSTHGTSVIRGERRVDGESLLSLPMLMKLGDEREDEHGVIHPGVYVKIFLEVTRPHILTTTMDDPEVSSKPRSGRIILEDDEEERGTCPDQEDQCSGAGSQTIKDLPFVCFPCANLLGEDVDSVHNDNDDGWTYTVKYDNFSELDICCTRCSISEHQRQIDTRGHCALCDRAACRECTALLRVKTSGPSSEGEGDACIVCRLCDHVLDINLGCLCVSERRYDFLMGNLDTTPRGISYAVVKGANDSFCGRDTEAKIFADSSDEASIATSCEEDGDCSETMDNVNLDANQTPAIHRVVSSQNVTAEQVEAPLSPSQKVTLVPEQEMTDVQLVPSSDVPAVPGAYSESSSAGLSEVAVAHIPTPVAAAAAQEYMGTPIKFSNRRKHSSHSFAEENLAASPSGSSTDSAINLSNSPSPFDRESKRTRRERARDMLAAGVVGSIVGGISMFAGLAALGASTD